MHLLISYYIIIFKECYNKIKLSIKFINQVNYIKDEN